MTAGGVRGLSATRANGRAWGFAPTRRGPFVSAKGPKTIGARAWPQGVPLPQSRLLGLRNSLRSDSPRLQPGFGTEAQPRPKAPGKDAWDGVGVNGEGKDAGFPIKAVGIDRRVQLTVGYGATIF